MKHPLKGATRVTHTMPKPKYPWKSTHLGESFVTEMPNPNYARGVAWQRKRYGEFWSVRYDKQTKLATYTRISESAYGKYNWNLLPGEEQVYTFPDRVTAGKAMGRCMRQVYRQNMAVSPTTRNWIIAPNYDGLGFTLRRRQR